MLPDHYTPGAGYRFEYIEMPNGLDELRVSYVLTMTHSERIHTVMEELRRVSLSKHVFILYNDGYKSTERNLCDQKPIHDACRAHGEIMLHAERNFPNDVIAVYEDDFFWSERDDLVPRLRSACRYVQEHTDSVHHYYLGGIPCPSIHALKRFVTRHVRSPIVAVHAALHTPIGIQRYLSYIETDNCSIGFCDVFMGARAHMHNVPLAYQLFPDTPSQRESWSKLVVLGVKILGLSRSINPGYQIVYTFSYMAPLVVLSVLVALSRSLPDVLEMSLVGHARIQ